MTIKQNKNSISVVVPCFNHDKFVEETLTSILNQTFSPKEVIVVDDCSTDDSYNVVQRMLKSDQRIKLIRHSKNSGVSAARNHALSLATGEFVAFCDADDLWLPFKLETQLRKLNQHTDCNVVYSDSTIIDDTGEPLGKLFSDFFPVPENPTGNIFNALCRKNFINTQTVMIRRACLDNKSAFDNTISIGEDWWCWIQLASKHKFAYCQAPLAKYRQHESSTFVTHQKSYINSRFRIYRKILSTFGTTYPDLAAMIWYEIGCCLAAYRRRILARKCFGNAVNELLSKRKYNLALIRSLVKYAAPGISIKRGK